MGSGAEARGMAEEGRAWGEEERAKAEGEGRDEEGEGRAWAEAGAEERTAADGISWGAAGWGRGWGAGWRAAAAAATVRPAPQCARGWQLWGHRQRKQPAEERRSWRRRP